MSTPQIIGINKRPRISANLLNCFRELASMDAKLVAPAVPRARALSNRCACGQQISDKRRYCRDCFEMALRLVAAGEASPTTVQLILEHSTVEERAEVIERYKLSGPSPL